MGENSEHEELLNRVGKLEFDLAHQQRLVEQLNEVVTDQTMQLTRFARLLPELQEQLSDLKRLVGSNQPAPANEKPPHY